MDLWNFFDLISIVLNLLIITLDFEYTNEYTDGAIIPLRLISAAACFIMYIKVFYFLRIFESTAPFVRMIIETNNSIRVFIFLFFFMIVASANSFFILSHNDPEDDDRDVSFSNPIGALIYSYLLALGEFDYSFNGPASSRYFEWAFFLSFTYLLLIVMLNLIIAIMGSTYA